MTGTDWGDMVAAGFDGIDSSNRDLALFIIGERDLDSQLIAIKAVLRRNSEAEKLVTDQINALDAQIRTYAGECHEYRQYMEEHRVDTLHGTVFQDAAHSMSAIGMLAPFVESLFVSIFHGLHERAQEQAIEDPRAKAMQKQYWNPQLAFSQGRQRNDIVAGIAQLASSTGLQSFLPEGYQVVLSALFSYRNNMFHNGFEWPHEARRKFANRIDSEGWPGNWFTQATRGEEPWVFYMSDDFITHCLQMIDQVLEGVGRYLEQGEPGQI